MLKRAAEVGVASEDVPDAGLDEAAWGDKLFELCDAMRKAGIDPELALNGATDRFINRFERAEADMLAAGERFEDLSPERLRKYWDLVKL